MTVQLREQTGAEPDRQQQAGNFATADDVGAAGLQSLGEHRARAEIRAKVAAGFAELDRGEGLDGDTVFRQRLAESGEPSDGARP